MKIIGQTRRENELPEDRMPSTPPPTIKIREATKAETVKFNLALEIVNRNFPDKVVR